MPRVGRNWIVRDKPCLHAISGYVKSRFSARHHLERVSEKWINIRNARHRFPDDYDRNRISSVFKVINGGAFRKLCPPAFKNGKPLLVRLRRQKVSGAFPVVRIQG